MKTHASTIIKLLPFLFVAALVGTAQDKVEATTKTVSFQNGADGYEGAFEIGIQKNGKANHEAMNIQVGRKFDYKNQNLEEEFQALVRFADVFGKSPSQVPPGASITNATLRLNVGSKKEAATYHRIFLNRMLVPWDAKAAWKNDKWGKDGIQANGKDAVAEPDAMFIPHLINTAYDIDVTESVRAWSKGEPNYGWVLRNTRDQFVPGAFITSRLKTGTERRPMLTVTYDTDSANKAPEAKNVSSKSEGANSATLSLTPTDDGKTPLSVTFYGRKRAAAGPDFEVILLPDTQYYTMKKFGGKPEMLTAQIDWIIKNYKSRGIAFALQLGDLTDTGDVYESEWEIIGPQGLYRLEDPKTTGLPEGVPYAVAVGNHDLRQKLADGSIRQNGNAGLYNKYFGAEHFRGKSYYGGHFGDNNNNYYAFFDGGSEKFIVISLQYDFQKRSPGALKWAEELLKKHADRRGIVITHATIMPGVQGEFQDDGDNAYNALKGCPNLMMIVGGHTTGEGHRTDEYKGAVVHSLVQDFQFDGDGGDGWLGILTFSPRENKIRVQTYSPYLKKWRTESDANYTLDYDFGTKLGKFEKIGGNKVASGEAVSCTWNGLAGDTDYEWFAEISDGQKTTRTKLSGVRQK